MTGAPQDLRAFGWAPGDYLFRCRDCTPPDAAPTDWPIGDKRAWRCEACATKKAAEAAGS